MISGDMEVARITDYGLAGLSTQAEVDP